MEDDKMSHKEDLSVKCTKFSVDGDIVELEGIDVKNLLFSIIEEVGLGETLTYIIDSPCGGPTEIAEFVEESYGMEEIADELSDERQEEIKEHLS